MRFSALCTGGALRHPSVCAITDRHGSLTLQSSLRHPIATPSQPIVSRLTLLSQKGACAHEIVITSKDRRTCSFVVVTAAKEESEGRLEGTLQIIFIDYRVR